MWPNFVAKVINAEAARTLNQLSEILTRRRGASAALDSDEDEDEDSDGDDNAKRTRLVVDTILR